MKQKSKLNQSEKFLSKTQEVLYQKEFKHADRVYNQLSQKGNRG
ncbi:YfhE family protein [Virgibacillus sp. C22-A2]|uniref:YfhE family protein n=1 Tax=Virgibacillus tibetensis TaxID=3042313 RepID=A0ABU6KFQ5_9BACI|nr:YfhE family protein [Virgibacillus sp. C22-A2]